MAQVSAMFCLLMMASAFAENGMATKEQAVNKKQPIDFSNPAVVAQLNTLVENEQAQLKSKQAELQSLSDQLKELQGGKPQMAQMESQLEAGAAVNTRQHLKLCGGNPCGPAINPPVGSPNANAAAASGAADAQMQQAAAADASALKADGAAHAASQKVAAAKEAELAYQSAASLAEAASEQQKTAEAAREAAGRDSEQMNIRKNDWESAISAEDKSKIIYDDSQDELQATEVAAATKKKELLQTKEEEAELNLKAEGAKTHETSMRELHLAKQASHAEAKSEQARIARALEDATVAAESAGRQATLSEEVAEKDLQEKNALTAIWSSTDAEEQGAIAASAEAHTAAERAKEQHEIMETRAHEAFRNADEADVEAQAAKSAADAASGAGDALSNAADNVNAGGSY